MSGDKRCLVCGRKYPLARCMVVEITAEEEAVLVRQGAVVPEEFVYCEQCWKIIRDPQTGPRLMRDSFERQILVMGVPSTRAREIADRYLNRLVELQRGRQRKIH